MNKEIIKQIKKIPGVKEIYKAGEQSIVVVFNPSEQISEDTKQTELWQLHTQEN